MAVLPPWQKSLLWSALPCGFIVYLILLSSPADSQLATFSITPMYFYFYLRSEGGTFTRIVKPYFQCTIKGTGFQYANITRTLLDRKGLQNASTKQVAMMMVSTDATTSKVDKWRLFSPFRENKTRFSPFGRLNFGTGEYSGFIRIVFDQLTCADQAYYACEVSYNVQSRDKKSQTLMFRKSGDYLNLKPFGLKLQWIEPASKETKLTPGMKVKVKCTGNVGTLDLGGGPVQITWTYRSTNRTTDLLWLEGREWAKGALEYGPEADILGEDGQFCTRQQEVTLSFTVEAQRDSNRIYQCSVKRVLASRKVEYETFTDERKQYIEVPDFYPPKPPQSIGARGIVGAIAATIAFLAIAAFNMMWYVRVRAKKKARAEEIDKRKEEIDNRRRSIVNIVEARRRGDDE